MAKLSTSDLANLQNEATAVSTLNANFAAVRTAMDNTLSRDGTTPNTMSANLDMNSNRILNLPAAVAGTEPIRKTEFAVLETAVDNVIDTAQASADAAAASASSASTSAGTATTQAGISTAQAVISTAQAVISTAQASAAAISAATASAATVTVSVNYTWSSSIVASDPGNGTMRFNNATLASVTALYVDNLDQAGNTVTGWLDTFDDSTAVTKGYIMVRQAGSSTTFVIFTMTGSVVDSTGYRTITVTRQSSGGSFTNGGTVVVAFFRNGDSVGVDFNSIGSITVANNDRVLLGDVSNANASGYDTVTNLVQSVTAPQFTTIELGNASDTTLARSGAGAVTVEGVQVALNSTALPHTCSQLEVGAASDTTIARSGAGAITVEGVQVVLANTSPTLGTITTTGNIELGNASDTTVSRVSAGVIAVEGASIYPGLPINSQSAAYGILLADANTAILHPTADNNARTFTLPANGTIALPVGTVIHFINQINTVTIAITTDTMTFSGPGLTGSRTLAANGWATAVKVASTSWVITGTNLT